MVGFLVDLISPSVTSGFTSATALIIVAAQLKGLLGLSFTAESVGDNIRLIVTKWDDVRPADAALGAVCCSVLLLLRVCHIMHLMSPNSQNMYSYPSNANHKMLPQTSRTWGVLNC